MKYHNNNLRNRIFDKIFLNVHISITIVVSKKIKFCFLSPHAEGTVSQIFYLGLSFYFMSKNRKQFSKF